MEALKKAFPTEAAAVQGLVGDGGDKLDFKPEEIEMVLTTGLLMLSDPIYLRLQRKLITPQEAERWAKCTRIVYWNWLQTLNAGYVLWAVMTAGLIYRPSTKPKKDTNAANAANKTKESKDAQS